MRLQYEDDCQRCCTSHGRAGVLVSRHCSGRCVGPKRLVDGCRGDVAKAHLVVTLARGCMYRCVLCIFPGLRFLTSEHDRTEASINLARAYSTSCDGAVLNSQCIPPRALFTRHRLALPSRQPVHIRHGGLMPVSSTGGCGP